MNPLENHEIQRMKLHWEEDRKIEVLNPWNAWATLRDEPDDLLDFVQKSVDLGFGGDWDKCILDQCYPEVKLWILNQKWSKGKPPRM